MAERCRAIRTNLMFASQPERPLRSIMITSPSSTEGKSSTATNLALSFCQAQKKVILMDGDMRRPRLHQIFPPPVSHEGIGLAQVLQGKIALADALVSAGADGPENLLILPCGEPPQNPAELLESPGCRRVLAELTEMADIVIVDTPPVLPVTDPMIMARFVDGVCMVARCDTTTRGGLAEAVTNLRQGDTNLLGVILNEVQHHQDRYAYDYGYYAYRQPQRQPEQA
jgi:capsular exopolysaccharide synthesis family protein